MTEAPKAAEHKEAPKAAPQTGESATKAATKSAGPYDNILGVAGMPVGAIGWLSLDAAGVPTGVYEFPPAIGSGVNAIRVRKQVPRNELEHVLVTESGAELTPPLNPATDIRFVGSPPEAYEASANKYGEHREAPGRRHTGESTIKDANPQLHGAYDEVDTHSRNRGVVEGSQHPDASKGKVEPKEAKK